MPSIWKNFDHVFEVFRFESWVKKQVEKEILNITSGFFFMKSSDGFVYFLTHQKETLKNKTNLSNFQFLYCSLIFTTMYRVFLSIFALLHLYNWFSNV